MTILAIVELVEWFLNFISVESFCLFKNVTGPATPGEPGAHGTPLFYVTKRKKGDKGKKERASKQKLLKGCNHSQNIIILTILERLEFENFSCRPTMVAENTFQCSMAPHFEIHFAGPVLESLNLSNILGLLYNLGQKDLRQIHKIK